MVDSINALNNGYVQQNVVSTPTSNIEDNTDKSIFLEEVLEETNDKQGFIGKSWNSVKEGLGVGLSASDCSEIVEKYKNGEVSYEEALETLQSYNDKESSMTDLFANIATGIASIAVATAAVSAGPIGWLTALAIGAPTGALVKTGLKVCDRATNNVEDDEFDTKQMTKDVVTGAVTGMTSAVSSGIGAGIKTGSIGLSIKNGAKCGALCGGVSGATNYVTDVALDDDKYFNAGDFAKTTLTSAAVSGSVGAVVGGTVFKITNPTNYSAQTVNQTIVNDSIASSSRKVLGNMEKETLGIVTA
jgi:hypothetical protein